MSSLGVVEACALAVAVVALLDAGWRVGGWATPEWAPRVLATSAFAGCAAVTEALTLGVAGLGSNQFALLVAAVATSAVVRVRIHVDAPTIGLSDAERRAWPVAGGVALGWIVWLVRHPYIGIDGVSYHLPEVVRWVHSGHPGTTIAVNPIQPFSSYPLVNEVLASWMSALARSLVLWMVWPVVAMVLLVLAIMTLLRGLGVPQRVAGLTVAAVITGPLFVADLVAQSNDVPAITWLACSAALLERSRSSPRLLGAAALAMALSVGTKTTTLPFALALVVVAVLLHRDRIHVNGRALITASGWTAPVVVVGGLWYLRDLYTHGSPLWPTTAAPWGDPLPVLQAKMPSFISRPRWTLHGRVGEYRRAVSGHLLALAAAPPLGILAARRLAFWGAIATAAGALLWMAAPTTGVSSDPFLAFAVVGAVRYLMPTLALSCVVLAVATTSTRRAVAVAATTVLVLVVGWNVVQLLAFGAPILPSATFVIVGLAAGMGASWGVGVLSRRMRRAGLVPVVLGAGTAVLLVATVVVGTNGFSRRHAATFGSGGGVMSWLSAHPQLAERDIAMGPVVYGPFTGDRFERNVDLILPSEPCPDVRARVARQIVVLIRGFGTEGAALGARVRACFEGEVPTIVDGDYSVFVTGS